jgi:hypothetical protein
MCRRFEEVFSDIGPVIVMSKNIILHPVSYAEVRNRCKKFGDVYKTNGDDTEFMIIGKHFASFVKVIQMIGMREARFIVYAADGEGEAIISEINKVFKDLISHKEGSVNVEVSWYYNSKDGIRHHSFTEPFIETVHQEAYPYIDDMENFIKGYLDSSSSILLMMGVAGSGKTRLIRYICQQAGKIWNKDPKVIYTSDIGCLEEEGMFIEFRCDDYDFMVLEDLDDGLGSRKAGNKIVHKFLASSDGFVAAREKKIILSTNLYVADIDAALIRPGRCYACFETKALNADEATILSEKLGKKMHFEESATVSEIYNSVFKTSSNQLVRSSNSVGFKKR